MGTISKSLNFQKVWVPFACIKECKHSKYIFTTMTADTISLAWWTPVNKIYDFYSLFENPSPLKW